MNNNVCLDVQNSGQCMKGEDCTICSKQIEEVNLNLNAKVYVPKSKQPKSNIQEVSEKLDKLNFNLSANEYVPKLVEEENNEEEESEDEEELDMIVNDIINNDMMEELEDDESDDEKWFPKYKDCVCCKGFVYKCQGPACLNMGTCYCKVKEECDDDGDN
jgi:hypothetical protein